MTDRTWTEAAACRGHANPDLWFPTLEDSDNHGREAKAICRGCPVRTECLTAAVANNEQYGIHAGAGEDALRYLRRSWVLDGLWNGPVWSLALAAHFRKLDGERVPVTNRNGPGANHGHRVTYARGCRDDCAGWCCLSAAVDGQASKLRVVA